MFDVWLCPFRCQVQNLVYGGLSSPLEVWGHDEASWSPMEPYGMLWRLMKPSWSPMQPSGVLWNLMQGYGASCSPMEPFGDMWTPRELYGALCCPTWPCSRLGAGWSATEPCEGLPSLIKALGTPTIHIVLCRVVCSL